MKDDDAGLKFAQTQMRDLIARLKAVKSGGTMPSGDEIAYMMSVANSFGLDISSLDNAAKEAEKAQAEKEAQARQNPSTAISPVEEAKNFFKSPEMQFIQEMQEKRANGFKFDPDGNPKTSITKKDAIREANIIDHKLEDSRKHVSVLKAKEDAIFASKDFTKHESELDEILNISITQAKLEANSKVRKETGKTNDELYSTKESGTEIIEKITAAETQAEDMVLSRFEKRIKERRQQLERTAVAKPRHTVERYTPGVLVSPPATPTPQGKAISQSR